MRHVLGGKLWTTLRVPICFAGILLLFGCEEAVDGSAGKATPPAGTTSITLGSSGYVSLNPGTRSGEVGIFIVDQDNNPFADARYLSSANVTVEVRRVSRRTSSGAVGTLQTASSGSVRRLRTAQSGESASDIRVTYRGGTSGQSISYALTLDRSGSMSSSDNRNMEQAAVTFVNNTRSGDEGAVVNFGSSVSVDQNLTSDKRSLIAAIQNPNDTGGYTALFDSIGEAVSVLRRASNSIRAVICMTDGNENNSSSFRSVQSVIDHANDKRVPVHCVGIGGADESVLRRITDATNGLYSSSSSSSDLATLYQRISNTLSSSYGIAFTAQSAFVSGETYEVTITVDYGDGITDSITVTSEA